MEKSYLDKLKFKSEYLKTWVAQYLDNIRLTVLLFIFLLVFGLFSFITLPRELNPSVEIPFVLISTALPGASPTDVESLITKKIEDELKSVKRLNTMSSNSIENASLIYLEFDSGVDPDEAERKVIQAVDKVSNLPEDASDPQVQKLDFEDQPVWTFTLEGEDDQAALRFLSEEIKEKLESEALIDRVEITTSDTREIQIILNKETISQYGLNPFSLITAIKQSLVSYPAGSVDTTGYSFPLTIDKSINNLDELRKKIIVVNGDNFFLEELAEVYLQEKIDQKKAYQIEPNQKIKEIVTFLVYKNRESKINEAVFKAQEDVTNILKQYQEFKINTIYDFAKEIDDQFNSLGINFLTTIVLVFLIMFLFVGLREALVASVSIPVVVLAVLIVMQMCGITINFISLFSLLLALGLLVDNAIVIVSAVSSYYKTKKFSPRQTAILVWRDYFEAIFANNITTVWAFLPLLLTTGVIGEFIKPVPIVVSVSIIFSALVAFFITLPFFTLLIKAQIPLRVRIFFSIVGLIILNVFLFKFIPKTNLTLLTFIVFYLLLFVILKNLLDLKKKRKENLDSKSKNLFLEKLNVGFINLAKVEEFYVAKLKTILISKKNRIKILTMIVIFTIFAYSLPVVGIIKNEFFPKSDSDLLYLEIELPSGVNLNKATIAMKEELEQLGKLNVIKYVTGEVGKSAPSAGMSMPASNNNLLFTLALKDKDQREDSSMEIAQQLRQEYKNYKKGKASVYERSSGPPSGSDLELSILGEDLGKLQNLGNNLEEKMKNEPGVVNLSTSFKDNLSKIVFKPDQKKLSEYGVDYQTLGFFLRTLATGFQVDTMTYENQEYDLTLKMTEKKELSESLVSLNIPTRKGNVPFLALGELKLKSNPLFIQRQDNQRSVTITASVEDGYNIPELSEKMENYAKNEINLPSNYQLKTGGVNDENQKSIISILQAMILSALLILATLVIQLKSFRKAFIVMSVIPVAISGVFVNFAIFNISLSFPSLIGLLSLFGIVVNNSILIVEKINQNLEIGLEFLDAILDACRSRLEPILLTSLTTIFGLIPITLSDPIWQGLGGAIIAGLSFSGILLLFFIPVLFYLLFNHEVHREKTKKITTVVRKIFN